MSTETALARLDTEDGKGARVGIVRESILRWEDDGTGMSLPTTREEVLRVTLRIGDAYAPARLTPTEARLVAVALEAAANFAERK